MLPRVGDLLVTAHPPFTNRREHLDLGSQRRDGRVDPDLIVALAGAAVGDRVAAVLAGRLDGEPGDQRPRQGREQRIPAAVEGVGPDRRQHELRCELLARVDDERLDRTHVLRLGGDRIPVLAGLAQLNREGDDLGAVLLLDPVQHHAGVETTRVEQQDAPDLIGVSLVGGDRGMLI